MLFPNHEMSSTGKQELRDSCTFQSLHRHPATSNDALCWAGSTQEGSCLAEAGGAGPQLNSAFQLDPTLSQEAAEVTHFLCFSEEFANVN